MTSSSSSSSSAYFPPGTAPLSPIYSAPMSPTFGRGPMSSMYGAPLSPMSPLSPDMYLSPPNECQLGEKRKHHDLVGHVFGGGSADGPPTKTKQRKKRRKRKKNFSQGIFQRETKLVKHPNVYYNQRYFRTVSIDPRLAAVLNAMGTDWFVDKQVVDFSCGCDAFNVFYIAAYLGAARVVGISSEEKEILQNLKQLRKFKHDGIPLDSKPNANDPIPELLVKRSGAARISNKPWRLEARYVVPSEKFPSNVDFRLQNLSTDLFDVSIFWGSPAEDFKTCSMWAITDFELPRAQWDLVKQIGQRIGIFQRH